MEDIMTRLKDTKVYTINDFYGWYENKELVLAPKYQRKAVWNSKAESYLIDTILRGLPIPQVFVRQSIDPLLRKTQREVIDGQQRFDIRKPVGVLGDHAIQGHAGPSGFGGGTVHFHGRGYRHRQIAPRIIRHPVELRLAIP